MGPLLLCIFINDFPPSVKRANVVVYADDATLYFSSTTISELRNTLQLELDMAVKWMKMNKLVLNTTKTKCTVFNNMNVHHLSLGGPLVEQVSRVNLLGVRLDH